ncbi:MAG: hypothetical protein WCP12_10200 [bacterium]
MKRMIYLCAVMATYFSMAQQPPPMKVAKRDPAAVSNNMARTGGLIQRPVEGREVIILDSQEKVTVANQSARGIKDFFRIPVMVRKEKAGDPISMANTVLAEKKVGMVIVVCESSTLPSLLVAPEARWAVVNVRALFSDKPTDDVLVSRVDKEIVRAFGYVGGAANSMFDGCAMSPIYKPTDLDGLKAAAISPGPLPSIFKTLGVLGITPIKYATYKMACEEGWAPMPTNSFQKAIWEAAKEKKNAVR